MAYAGEILKPLDGVAASGAPDFGDGWIVIANWDDVTVHVFGLGAGDEVKIQGSNEGGLSGSNPIDLATIADADDMAAVTDGIRLIRVGVTADGANGSSITAIVHRRKRN